MREHIIVPLVTALILVSCSLAEAQQPLKPAPRIGFIYSTGTPENPSPLFEAFRQGLRDLGYIDGKNVLIIQRYAEGRLDRMPAIVNDLVQQRVDLIIATNNVVIRAAKNATQTIPIVIVSSIDPVAAGYVESFTHPGGNITGLANLKRDLSAKRVELLRELLPKMLRLAILWDADGPGPAVAFKEYEAAARAFKLELRSLELRGPNPDFIGAFRVAKTAHADALIVVGNPLIGQYKKLVAELATKNRLPSITEEWRYVDAGGLLSYGANSADLFRQVTGHVDKILRGIKPGDLPIQLPNKFELVVNMRTAKTLGLTIPHSFLRLADRVIE